VAYPFTQAPTYRQFIDGLVANHGCQLRQLQGDLHGPRGPIKIAYLSRQVEGKVLLSEPLAEELDDRISPDSVRRLIVQLQLPKKCWMWAGDPYDYPFDD
jgi:hypothetical protein